MAGTTSAANPVQMYIGISGHLPGHNSRQPLDVEPTGRHVGGDEHRAALVGEAQQRLVPLPLFQFAVERQYREAALRELGGHIPYIVAGVAEDQRGVGLIVQQQRSQGVAAAPGLHLEEELLDVGSADDVIHRHLDRMALQAAAQGPDLIGIGCRKQQCLALLRGLVYDCRDGIEEAHVEHAVGLIEHQHPQSGELHRGPPEVVKNAARRPDDDVGCRLQRRRLGAHRDSAAKGDYPEVGNEAREAPHLGAHLVGKLAGGTEHENLHPVEVDVDARQQRQTEGHGLAAAGARLGNHVLAGEQARERVLLHRCHPGKAEDLDSPGQGWSQGQRGKSAGRRLVVHPQRPSNASP